MMCSISIGVKADSTIKNEITLKCNKLPFDEIITP